MKYLSLLVSALLIYSCETDRSDDHLADKDTPVNEKATENTLYEMPDAVAKAFGSDFSEVKEFEYDTKEINNIKYHEIYFTRDGKYTKLYYTEEGLLWRQEDERGPRALPQPVLNRLNEQIKEPIIKSIAKIVHDGDEFYRITVIMDEEDSTYAFSPDGELIDDQDIANFD
ncbi:MAG: hypothetical protein ACLFQU_11855 [Candidatus Kapaibacterium sp.]